MLEAILENLRNQLPVNHSPHLYEHELLAALYALKGKIKLEYEQLENGAVPLFKRGYFPWGALPYPREHAEFGLCLAHLGKKEAAQKLAQWQQFTLDHQNAPLAAFFSQESQSYEALQTANRELFNKCPVEPIKEGFFYDEPFSFCGYKDLNTTILSFGLGCKSGCAIFMHKDVGIVNMGPHEVSFGIAGKPKDLNYNISENKAEFSCQTQVAAPHPRKNILQDSGFSGVWLKAHHKLTPKSLDLSLAFESLLPIEQFGFSFFVKADKCVVANSHILRPQSSDCYEGPSTKIELRGKNGALILEAKEACKMKITPLPNENNFWGANFLISMPFLRQKFSIYC